jgi:mRNA interferase MazF
LPRRGDNFQSANYVPELGDIVHLNWDSSVGREMKHPHYGLVLSDTRFNHGTGLAIIVPITTARNKLSGFELAAKAGRVNGVALLSGIRAIDYQARDVQYEGRLPAGEVAEANRRVRLILPVT